MPEGRLPELGGGVKCGLPSESYTMRSCSVPCCRPVPCEGAGVVRGGKWW